MFLYEILAEAETTDFEGIKISFHRSTKRPQILVRALDDWGTNELGHVLFNIGDNNELDPQDLEVNERFQGQGIAKTMYDFVKSKGYKIQRSWDQTDAGAGFWNKHRGEDVRVWEDLTTGRNLNPDTEKYVKSHKWKLITVNPMHLDVDSFDDPYNRVIDIDVDHPVNFKDPIILDANGVIIDGFHRAYQAQRAGLETIPAYVPVQKQVSEAFNQPYPITWEHGEESHDALVTLPDGTNLSIMFNLEYGDYGADEWQVEFWRNNSLEVTGEGDAQRVFATVLNAIQQFIQKEHPWRIIFSAKQEIEPGKYNPSRSKLYIAMVRRYANALGYDEYYEDQGDQVVFELTRKKQGVAETVHPDISESLSRVAYHYTNIANALKIVTSGKFELSSSLGSIEQQYAPKGYNYFLSTTRTKMGNYHRSRASSYGAIFVLDGNWFNNHYISKPIDYWENRNPQSGHHRDSEAEDRVFSQEPSIPIGGVVAVHILADPDQYQPHGNAMVRELMISAKTQGIKTYLYGDFNAWANLDTRHTIKPTHLKGQRDKAWHRPKRKAGYMQHWIELMMINDQSKLSKRADQMRYSLSYTYDKRDAVEALTTDLSNARRPDSGQERAAAVRILNYMRQHKLNTVADFVDNIAAKWAPKTS